MMEKLPEHTRSHGIHWITAMFFIIADCAGGGIIALPTAAQNTNFYVGFFLCYLIAVVASVTAILLSKSWLILLRNWSAYRDDFCRKPYAEIGYRAMGKRAKFVTIRLAVSICLNFSQFGTCVVFFFVDKQEHPRLYCFIDNTRSRCLFIGLVLWPICMLKSPENFSWVIVGGMACTFIAIMLIVVGAGIDYHVCSSQWNEPKFKAWNFFSGLGTFLFTYAGHSAFPTVQHDMKKPREFTKSIICAFALIALSYAPVLILGHLAYGSSLRDSIINSIQTNWIQQSANLLIAFHCMLTLILMFSPINQEAEEYFKIPQEFGPKRVILRSGMLLITIFMAETVPSFGPVLDLFGSSTMAINFLIFPCLFYLFLTASERKSLETKQPLQHLTFKEMISLTSRRTLILCFTLIFFAILGGGVATVSAFRDITHTKFEVPCFVKPFVVHEYPIFKSTNCCGPFQNVTVNGDEPSTFCNAPNLKFYG
ncbi:Transmembrane amino acid transporter protein [Aphelenchoides besseyi]|nr:Transmembrane amino acid transporter protein [Aphelenchoides besseyi]